MIDLMTMMTKQIREKDTNSLLKESRNFDFKIQNYTDATVDLDSFMRGLKNKDKDLYDRLNNYISKNKREFEKSLVDEPKRSSSHSSSSSSGGCGSSSHSNGGCGISSSRSHSYGGGCGSSSHSNGGC